MIINEEIKDEKLQHRINTEAAKILALSSGKIDKYEFVTDEGILPFDQSRIIKQANLIFSPLQKQKKRLKSKGKNK